MTGKLVSVERPDPDINYDFQLQLDTPYFDELNAQGPQEISSMLLLPRMNLFASLWQQMSEML